MTPQDEDHHGLSNEHPNRPYFQPPPQLPPETYTYLIHALLSLQGHAHPHNYHPYTNYNHPWSSNDAPPVLTASVAAPSSFHPTIPQSTGPVQLPPSPAAPAAQDPEETEDAIYITEDKRRRNTAASARFRIKKKLKTLSLERTVSDLTGRTEGLEREANDLRRENAWLKEIVLLRGRNLAASTSGSQAPAPDNQHDMDDRTHPSPKLELTVGRREKGKDKES